MDIVDKSFDSEQDYIRSCVQKSRKKENKLIPTGYCYNCNEKIPSGKLYCDSFCKDDHEDRQRSR